MPSTFQTSFANRYTKARELVSYLGTLTGYSPGVDALTAPKLTELLNDINAANSIAASKNSLLQTERSERTALIKGEVGLISRSAQVRDYLASILPKGKKAKDYERAQKIIQKMRGGTKPRKSSADENGSPAKTTSTSELSFASILGNGRDLLELIKLVPGYAPSNSNLTVANYEALLNSVAAKNSSVAQMREQYDDALEHRANLYYDLRERIIKIKFAIAAQYGKKSNEYKDSVKY